MENIRDSLVNIALEWEDRYTVMPQITSAISEYDAAKLVGCDDEKYSKSMKNQTAVTKGFDFLFENKKYQIKANRPSGKPGSKVTKVANAKNYDWDILIWILYDTKFILNEAWKFKVSEYKNLFDNKKRLSPDDMRKGECLYKIS
ncbi:MAG: hypothetical protein H7A25_13790 [Leptospiraceae bacterium]|nr:hypothetical protein [Leptospiraceae bacterium]